MLFIIPIIGVYKRISKALVPGMPAKFNFLLPLMMYLSKIFNADKLRVHSFPLKMYLIKRIQFLLLLLYSALFLNSGIFAQSNYPIFVSPTLTPPYSLKLSDYSKFGSQQLMVSIVVNDLNVSNLPVKLHIKLETVGVTIENPVTINTTPIFLDGGATNVLYGEDLKDYFDINNLVFKGYSKDTYKKTGQLPEGFYKITVEVLHFQTNRLISNQGSVTAWMALGKPPVLRMPENNIELGEFKGVPVVFSWLASNVGSPVSAGSVQYKFEMWEMRVDGISPYTVAATVPVFHEETTQKTMLSVYPSSLLMEPGMKYAWRVTATDLNGLVPFEQDGHSEIRIFTYKTKCDSVKGLKAKVAGNNGTFTWESAQNHTSYNIELKNPSTGWSSASETFENKAKFYDLNYGSTYKMRVQAVCNGDPSSVSDFSEWKSLVVPLKRTNADTASCPNCKCDDNLGAGKIENLDLRHDLKPGDTIVNRFGTTRFIVKSVESQGDGVYKGHFLFWAEMWKLKFLCEYWDLSVNTDNVIVNMDYESVYNPQYLLDIDATTAYLDKLAGDINELTVNAVIKDTISVNETITSVYVNAGDSIVAVTVGPNGELHEVVIQTDSKNIEQTMVKGQNGEEYVVTRDGEVMGVKEYQNTGGGNSRKIDEYIKEKESKLSAATVDFSASPNQKYGYDAFSSEKQAIVNEYPALKNSYRPAYKSIASFSPDKVIASASGKDISFRDEMGIPAIGSGNELTVRGGTDGDVTALYAYKAINDSTEEIAGKLNLMSFDEQTRKLYIIPVNKAQTPDAVTLQNTLNKVYGQAVTRWEVVKINKGIDVAFENGAMTHGGSNAISVYNSDQKAIINKFNETDDFEDDALYLFFIDNVQSKTGDIAGYMPLQRQVGFIYDNPSPLIIAHELGHGAFNLRHPFSSENFIASQGSTTNLMDYKDGSDLWKHQWNLIHDPENILFAWGQDEEEGEAVKDKELIVKANGKEYICNIKEKTEITIFYIDNDNLNIELYLKKDKELKNLTALWKIDDKEIKDVKYTINADNKLDNNFLTIKPTGFENLIYIYFVSVIPDLYYDESGAKKRLNSDFIVYGESELQLLPLFKEVSHYKITRGNVSKEADYNKEANVNYEIIKEIHFNDKVITENLNDLNTLSLTANSETSITVIPYFGKPFTWKVINKPAPVVIADIQNDFYDGSFSLESYQSYMKYDVNNKYTSNYSECLDKIDGQDYYIPLLNKTKQSSRVKLVLRPVNFLTLDGPCKYKVGPNSNLVCLKKVLYKDGSSAIFGELELTNLEVLPDMIEIKDGFGNIKGKIKLIDKTDKSISQNLYIFKLNYDRMTPSATDRVHIDNCLNKMTYGLTPLKWIVNDNIETISITPEMIDDINFGKYNKTDVKRWLATSKVSSNDEDSYKAALCIIYDQIIKKKVSSKETDGYVAIIMHNDMANIDGFAPILSKHCFITSDFEVQSLAHELGHCLGFPHFAVELGACDEPTIQNELSKCPAQTEFHNIMCYKNKAFDFYIWQINNILGRIKNGKK